MCLLLLAHQYVADNDSCCTECAALRFSENVLLDPNLLQHKAEHRRHLCMRRNVGPLHYTSRQLAVAGWSCEVNVLGGSWTPGKSNIIPSCNA
jgi:hypothetical protein